MRTRSRKSKTPQKVSSLEVKEEKVCFEEKIFNSDDDSNCKSVSDEILSSDDEAPLDISLKVSKKQSEEARQKQTELLNQIKEKKKSVQSMRELRNKQQKLTKMKTLVPVKLDEELLQQVDKEVSVDKIILGEMNKSGEPVLLNKKTTFSDDSDTLSNDGSEHFNCKIKPCVIGDVFKNDSTNPAQVFLQDHFFNNSRIKRKKYNDNPCNKAILKNVRKKPKVV